MENLKDLAKREIITEIVITGGPCIPVPLEIERKPYLEIELTEENQDLSLPPFLAIEREVTDDLEHTNYAIAVGGGR